jgi:hypothetical protein
LNVAPPTPCGDSPAFMRPLCARSILAATQQEVFE